MIRSKDDVEFHSEYGRDTNPAVNVKIHGSLHGVKLPLDLGSVDGRQVYSGDGFTHEWIEQHVPEDTLNVYWELATRDAWEQLQTEAEEIFGSGATVYSEGRSGGWALVDGIPDFDSWDAIGLMRWRRFAKAARALADDVLYQIIEMIYINEFVEGGN